MAIDFVKVNNVQATQPHAGMLVSFVTVLRHALDQGTKLKSIMDHMTDGVSYAKIEELFGLQAGEGEVVYNLVAGSVDSMTGSKSQDAKNLTERVG